jgi:antitoxin YefM
VRWFDSGRGHSRFELLRFLYTRYMARVIPFTEARARLTELLDDVEARHEHVVITRKGRPAAVVVSPEEWDAIAETLDVLQDDQTLADLRESANDVEAGRLFSLDDVRRELGLA